MYFVMKCENELSTYDIKQVSKIIYCVIVVFRSDEKIGYGIVWELQNDDRSLDAHDRLLLTPIKILIHPKYC